MLKLRNATATDARLYFDWANDGEVRKQSYETAEISWEEHSNWFNRKLMDPGCIMLLFENGEGEAVGQVRFQKDSDDIYIIGISVAGKFRGKGYATTMLLQAADHFMGLHPLKTIYAYIKKSNEGSVRSFSKAGFTAYDEVMIKGEPSFLYIKNNRHADS